MKTILIPIFQGIESRNILRTDIFNIIRSNKNIRIILLIPTLEKIDYLKKYFEDDNIVFELAPEYKKPRFNSLFTSFKFNLLKTKMMDIRRKVWLSRTRNYFLYYLKWLFNRVFARKFFRQIIRWLDFYLLIDDNYLDVYKKHKIDLVFLAHLFGDEETSLLRQAKKLKIKSIGLINSWDKITSRCVVRLLPDKLIVHNLIILKEAIKHVDMGNKDIEVVGIPHYDIYINSRPSPRDEFYKHLGVAPDKRILLYCPIGLVYSEQDSEFINLLCEFRNKKLIPSDTQILVRFPPNDEIRVDKLIYRDQLIFYRPGKRFSKKRGVDWDWNDKESQHLFDTLYYSSLVVCSTSSMSIDAAVFNKPIINIIFGDCYDYKEGNINIFFAAEHYANIIKTGGIRVVTNKEDLLKWLNLYLANPEIDSEGRRAIIEEQCWKLDGRSGERAANFILRHLYS